MLSSKQNPTSKKQTAVKTTTNNDPNESLNNPSTRMEDHFAKVNVKELCSLIQTEMKAFRVEFEKDLAKRIDHLEETLKDLMKEVAEEKAKELQRTFTDIKSDISKLNTAIALSTRTNQSNPITPSPITAASNSSYTPNLEQTISNALRENKEKEAKKFNLVFSGIPENKDIAETINNVHRALSVKTAVPPKLKRIGLAGTKPRPVLAIYDINDEESRRLLLNFAKKLRQLRSEDPLSSVYINPDLTKTERETSWKMRQKCKRRNENGERVRIRRGQITPIEQE